MFKLIQINFQKYWIILIKYLKTYLEPAYLTIMVWKKIMLGMNLGCAIGLGDGVSIGFGHHPAGSDVGLGLVVNVLRVRLKII
jgi:hypothetical protein